MRGRGRNRRRWIFAGVNVLLVLLAAVCGLFFHRVGGTLITLDAADSWKGDSDMDFAQIACFLPVDDTRTTEDILRFRRALDTALTQASVTAPASGSLYADAYSGEASLTVTGSHGTAKVRTIGVGGRFFLFHPLELRSGSYLSQDDLMQDRVLLDETTAWSLFGSPDVAGMTVTIEGKPYYVCGVISREEDFASQAAYGEEAGMFLSYDAFFALTQQGISCYEIVLPDLVSGFGLELVEKNFSVGTGEIRENSARYSLKNLFAVIGVFGTRSMRHNGVIYPYWENAVRMTEDWMALLLVLMLVFLACPVLSLTVGIIAGLVKTGQYLEDAVPAAAEELVDRHRRRRWEKRRKSG